MKTQQQIEERIERLNKRAHDLRHMPNMANDYDVMIEALEWVLRDD